MCTGTLPAYTDVEIPFSEGEFDHMCGWDGPEFLSQLNIVSRCVGKMTVCPSVCWKENA